MFDNRQLERRNHLVSESPPPKIAKRLNKPPITGFEVRVKKVAGREGHVGSVVWTRGQEKRGGIKSEPSPTP